MLPPHPPEPIAIVGSGRVAQALGRALAAGGARVVAVASPNGAHARAAASFIGAAVRAVSIDEIPPLASRIIIAVTDRHIPDAARALSRPEIRGAIVVHTSGASGTAPLQSLRDFGAACGVMHPLQTLGNPADAPVLFQGAPFAVLGDARANEWAGAVIEALGGWTLHPRETDMASYHAAAVMAGNSMWAVIDAAVALMGDAGVPPDAARAALASLARHSLDHALARDAAKTLTGPVARADLGTVRDHLAAMAGAAPHLVDLYRAVSLYLAEIAGRDGLTPEEARALKTLLAAPFPVKS